MASDLSCLHYQPVNSSLFSLALVAHFFDANE